MEAEKYYDQPSGNWKSGGILQSESEGLRTRGVNDVNPNPRASEMRWDVLAQSMRQGKEQITPSSTFHSIPALSGLDGSQPHWGGQSTKTTVPNANFIQKHPETRLNLGTCGSLKLMYKMNHTHLNWFFFHIFFSHSSPLALRMYIKLLVLLHGHLPTIFWYFIELHLPSKYWIYWLVIELFLPYKYLVLEKVFF